MDVPFFIRPLSGLLLLLAAQFVFAETETPPQSLQSLFSKMSRASQTINYQGSFTYEIQSSAVLQGFRISHWVVDGVEHERLLYLNGAEREIVRHGQALDCYSPGDQLLRGNLNHIGNKLIGLDEFYQFQIRYTERVAGRTATVLQVVPRDAYRHGYILSVDQETGLILKSLMVDSTGRLLERYQFLELNLAPDVKAMESAPPAERQHVASTQIGACSPTQSGQPQNWSLAWVPPGFVFAGQQKVRESIDMLMYTDGLTTFSVFIEPVSVNPPEGAGQRGSTVVYLAKLMNDNQMHRLTVVGEIPAAAAEQIADGVKYHGGDTE